eukprot:2666187-Prymnesium_polylepis.1
MIPQHSPTTQGSTHLPEARASLMPLPATARPLAASDAKRAMCGSRAPHALLGWGGAHRAVRPPGQRVRPSGQRV